MRKATGARPVPEGCKEKREREELLVHKVLKGIPVIKDQSANRDPLGPLGKTGKLL